MTASDDPIWFRELKPALLERWRRPASMGVDLEPSDVADEFAEWVDDDSRWAALGRGDRDWRSLLGDVVASWSLLGAHLERVIAAAPHVAALERVLAAQRVKEGLHRRAISDAAAHLAGGLVQPGTLLAAFEDLLEAAEQHVRPGSPAPAVRWHLALLASAGERHGHDWSVVADRLRNAVEWFPDTPFESRLDTARTALQADARQGRSVVWLCVDHASASEPSSDPRVELFDGDWLLAVLGVWTGQRAGVPPELAADPEVLARAWPRLHPEQPVQEQIPVVFARVDLGDGPTAGARDRARDTLELLLARASVLQGGTNWRISGKVIHFVDGDAVFESSGPVGDPDIYTRLSRTDVIRDPTAETIKRELPRLRAHLPVTDRRLRAALQLNQWLHDARRTGPPARLVLSSRIIEQCARWADLSPPAFVADNLAWSWCWAQVADELERAGREAVDNMRGHSGATTTPEERAAFLKVSAEIFRPDRDSWRPRVYPWKVLERLSWLIARFPPDGWIGDWLIDLSARTADGSTVFSWLKRLESEFTTQHARAVRTRNVIVHGGPLLLPTAHSIVGFQDEVAAHALESTMDALLRETTVVEHFAEQRRRYNDALETLRLGGDPAKALRTPLGD
ncbi:hypothetical protein OM076_13760 [Solirubrobacter ginsenosidimutans]|uniref:Uncharacterized protein n=1 Tax=Solirubrobacter ginsenosidimutans TaxID=490573 RepID=A0A9X3S0I4_9ACTN|nr:hypothetical protein [Solirubrobacter ginsenosidimutans]MDA0161339.1 hypothetical protein [Solirubrobacter ginsenosidimutans]